ncbi:hypothetical protein C8Q73DRAFT_456890 [Cubamyces lactineus]|nr:hypothetical protein C8Q73DRAFT_456890 [Cubamyces lactineus]
MSSLFQNSYYLAINFNAILYGVELVLYGMTMNALVKNRKKWSRTDKFYVWFSTALLFLITIYMSTEAVFGEEMWIVHQNTEGGPIQFLIDNADIWYQTMGTTASVILNLFSDALLIYRMYVVWTSYYVIMFPCFLYVATIALGIIELYASGKPDADFFVGTAAQLGVAYYTTTISLNVIATGVICGRLVYLGRALEAARNTQGRGKGVVRYTGTLSIVVESALPYSMAGFAFLVAYGIESDISILFGALYGMFTCISPQLIVLRVVTGQGWTKDQTAQSVSALEFENLGASRSAAATTAIETAAQSEGTSTMDHKSIGSAHDMV